MYEHDGYICFETNLHEVFHGLGVVGVPSHVVFFPLNRHRSSRFYKPACKSPASKLGCLRGQPKHVALLPKVQGYFNSSSRLGCLDTYLSWNGSNKESDENGQESWKFVTNSKVVTEHLLMNCCDWRKRCWADVLSCKIWRSIRKAYHGLPFSGTRCAFSTTMEP